MTIAATMPVTRIVDYKYSVLTEPFRCYSKVLQKWITIPVGFHTDWESVPLIKGTSKVSGLVHDYLCRIDSNPVVDKKTAAKVYLEFMKYRGTSFVRRLVKYLAVCIAVGYFHKLHTQDKLSIRKH